MSFFNQPIVTRLLRNSIAKNPDQAISDENIESARQQLRVDVIDGFRNFILIVAGVFSAGFGLNGFLLPNDFIDGGATGISLLLQATTGFGLSIFLIVVNAPFIFMGAKQIGNRFAVRSICAIILLAIVVHYVPYPIITDDKLLIAVFGGFFLGAGIGLAIRGGSVIDGTEVLAIYLSKKTELKIGDVILILNIFIFGVGAYILSIEIALYAILTYLAAAKTVDFIVDGIEEYIGVTIISPQSEEIRKMIIHKLERACTLYSGKSGYGEKPEDLKHIDIVYTVITRLEIAKIKNEVNKIDENAFVIMGEVKDTKGGMIKRKSPKH